MNIQNKEAKLLLRDKRVQALFMEGIHELRDELKDKQFFQDDIHPMGEYLSSGEKDKNKIVSESHHTNHTSTYEHSLKNGDE